MSLYYPSIRLPVKPRKLVVWRAAGGRELEMNGGRPRSGQLTNNYHIIFLSRSQCSGAAHHNSNPNCNGALFRRGGGKNRGAETRVVSWAGIADRGSWIVSAVRCGAVLGSAGRRAGGAVQLPA